MAKQLIAGLFLLTILVQAGPAQAANLAVPGTYPTLEAALAAAGTGDTITLAPGSHGAVGLRVPVGVTIRGGGAEPADTVLQAGGQGRILLIEDVPDTTVVANLTLTGGRAFGKTSHEQSGGAVFVHSSPARFQNVVFRDNEAGAHGGAVRAVKRSPLFEQCRFENNRAPEGGGGAIDASFGSSPVINGCDFIGNSAGWGGAIAVRGGGTAALIRGRVVGNAAVGTLGYGGGVFVDNGAVAGVIDVIVSGNTARYGGGLACFEGSQVNIDHATITDNTAQVQGGGLILVDARPWIGTGIIAFNTGTAISLVGTAEPRIACTDIFGNTGGNWTAELLALSNLDQNYAVDPGFCSRDPLAANGLRLNASSLLYLDVKSCGVPGVRSAPCGAADSPDVPVAGTGIEAVRAFPNPFNPRTQIAFRLDTPQRVTAVVYDVKGQRVRVLADTKFAAGDHQLPWDGTDGEGRAVGSGLYIVHLRGGPATQTLKITMLK